MVDFELSRLVLKARDGDRSAFEEIVRRSARMVYAQMAAAVRDRQRAEDLTQETFLAAWKGIAAVTDPAGFNGWLMAVARNVMFDSAKAEGRKKRKMPVGAAEGEAAASSPGPAEELEHLEARERALKMLAELPTDYREPLMMRYLAGADYETIRRELGLSDGALRGLLSRGMAILRERMSQSGERK